MYVSVMPLINEVITKLSPPTVYVCVCLFVQACIPT